MSHTPSSSLLLQSVHTLPWSALYQKQLSQNQAPKEWGFHRWKLSAIIWTVGENAPYAQLCSAFPISCCSSALHGLKHPLLQVTLGWQHSPKPKEAEQEQGCISQQRHCQVVPEIFSILHLAFLIPCTLKGQDKFNYSRKAITFSVPGFLSTAVWHERSGKEFPSYVFKNGNGNIYTHPHPYIISCQLCLWII